jgi:hypothetical protein
MEEISRAEPYQLYVGQLEEQDRKRRALRRGISKPDEPQIQIHPRKMTGMARASRFLDLRLISSASDSILGQCLCAQVTCLTGGHRHITREAGAAAWSLASATMSESAVLSSVVIIPEECQTEPPNGHPLKRRQSSVPASPDSNKRPRLNTQTSSAASNHGDTSPTTVAPTASSPTAETHVQAGQNQASPPAPRRRQTSGVEQDKSRNRRLFGALLGTLSQSAQPNRRASASGAPKASSPTTTGPSRREEIESRQRERLKRQSFDIAESARLKRETLQRARRLEQIRWDEEAMNLRHKTMRATARFLQTKTEPKLYYKPWELRAPEDAEIARQIEDVDSQVEREREAFEDEKKARLAALTVEAEAATKPETAPPVKTASLNGSDTTHENRGSGTVQETQREAMTNGSIDDIDVEDSTKDVSGLLPEPDASPDERQRSEKPTDVPIPMSSSKTDEHDHGGEELERGQEDDVIY